MQRFMATGLPVLPSECIKLQPRLQNTRQDTKSVQSTPVRVPKCLESQKSRLGDVYFQTQRATLPSPILVNARLEKV